MLIHINVKVFLILKIECSKKCETCKNDDKDYCLSCNSFTILNGTTCSCPIGKYYDANSEC